MDEEVLSLETLLENWEASAELIAAAHAPDGSSDDTRASVTRSTLCRRRQREELLQLRNETVALEQQLHRLRSAKETSTEKNVWRRIAEIQRKLKLEAETENARLRQLVSDQRNVKVKLEKVLHASQSIQEVCERELRLTKKPRSTKADSWLGFERVRAVGFPMTQDSEVAAMCTDVFPTEGIGYGRVDFTTDANGRVVMESTFCQVFEFDLQTTTAAVWRCYSTPSIDFVDGWYSANRTTSGLLVGLMEIPVKVEDMTVMIWSQFKLRCIQESSDRVLILWEDLSEKNPPVPLHTDGTADSRIQMKCDVYIGLEKQSSEGGPLTVVRARTCSRPGSQCSAVHDPIGTSRAQLAQVVRGLNRCFTQKIETYLLDELMKNTLASVV